MSLIKIVTSPGYKCLTCNYRYSATQVKDGKIEFYKTLTRVWLVFFTRVQLVNHKCKIQVEYHLLTLSTISEKHIGASEHTVFWTRGTQQATETSSYKDSLLTLKIEGSIEKSFVSLWTPSSIHWNFT